MSNRTHTFYTVAVAAVLGAALCQVGIGAQFTASGEQAGLAVPLSSAVLALVFLLCMVVDWPPRVPTLGRMQSLFLVLFAVGIVGLPRVGMTTGAKELVQILEMTVLASFVFERAGRRNRAPQVARVFAALCGALLVLACTNQLGHPWIQLSHAKYAAFVILAWPFAVLAMKEAKGKVKHIVLILAALAVGLTFRHGWLILAWYVVFLASAVRFRPVALKWLLLAALLAGAATALPLYHRSNPWRALSPRHDAEHLSRFSIEAVAAVNAPRYVPLGGGAGRYKETINELKQYQPHVPHPEDLKVPRDGNNQYLLTMVEASVPAAVALLLLLLVNLSGRGMREDADRDFQGARRIAVLGALLAGVTCVLVSRGSCIWLGALIGLSIASRPQPKWLARVARLVVPAAAIAAAAFAMQWYNRQLDPLGGISTANREVRRHLYGERGLDSLGIRIVQLRDELETAKPEDVIEIEAEMFDTATAPFTVIRDNNASNGHATAIPQDEGKGTGKAVYTVDIPVDGFYLLYARVYWLDGCSNSLLLEVGKSRMLLASDIFGRWHTLETKEPIRLGRGPATLTLHNVEDGVRCDTIGLRKVPPPMMRVR